MTNNTHDDGFNARLEEIRSRHNSTSTDYDKDDLGSDAISRMFEARERRQARGELPPPPPPTRPKKSLTEMLIAIGCRDRRPANNN